MKPRFLLDENVELAVQRQLRRQNIQMEVLAVGDNGAPPLRSSDPDILHWIETSGHILVTWDRRTMPEHIADHYNAGGRLPRVLLIRHATTLGQIVEALHLIWAAADAEEYQDTVQYIP
ncbi:MAG: DUF5615 family PIN-like protein [Anaerolineales bacterium]|nr:DUF5615 family PIN-like protein [Anaerolineales bacterium]